MISLPPLVPSDGSYDVSHMRRLLLVHHATFLNAFDSSFYPLVCQRFLDIADPAQSSNPIAELAEEQNRRVAEAAISLFGTKKLREI